MKILTKNTTTSAKGFTLVEIMIVVVIIGLLAASLFSQLDISFSSSKVNIMPSAVKECEKLCTTYVSRAGASGLIPITEGTIPSSQFSGTGVTSELVAKAATLDRVFLQLGLMRGPLQIPLGNRKAVPTGTTPVTWNEASFRFTATAAPDMDYSQVSRLECAMTTALAPSAAAGSNFRRDGVVSLPANSRVIYLAIPSCTLTTARELSLAMDGPSMTPADTTTADDSGSVSYAVTEGTDLTTAYVFVTSL